MLPYPNTVLSKKPHRKTSLVCYRTIRIYRDTAREQKQEEVCPFSNIYARVKLTVRPERQEAYPLAPLEPHAIARGL